jgi:hypothetical protein
VAGDCAVGAGSYRSWQDALETRYLPESPGAWVIFFVDDEELRYLAPRADDPASDLAAAAGEMLTWSRGDVFLPVRRQAAQWRLGPQADPPPVLPLLAASVLAASRMHADAQVAANNFYLRLAQVLRPGLPPPVQEQARRQLIDRADDLAAFWRDLDRWLRDNGGRGRSTIRAHSKLTRIGYPLSQAVVRWSDRAVLTHFFAALGLPEAGVPAARAVLTCLRIWAERPRGISQAMMNWLGNDEMADMVAEVVHGLAESWDGAVLDPRGLRRLEFRLVLDLAEGQARWAVPAVQGVDSDLLTDAHGAFAIAVSRQRYSDFYELSGALPSVIDTLRHGLKVSGESTAATIEPAQALVLRDNPSVGGWLAQASIEPFAEQVLVVEASLQRHAERMLSEAADAGWRMLRQRAGSAVLPGYAIFSGVRFSDEASLRKALVSLPGIAGRLQPDPTARPRLVNGLPLDRGLSHSRYLAGGAPDLLLPVGSAPRWVEASYDGCPQHPPFIASGFPIPLRLAGSASPGTHEVVVDGERLAFTLATSSAASDPMPGAAEIGWDTAGALTAGPRAQQAICGALCTGPVEQGAEPVLIRRGFDAAWEIDTAGTCWPLIEPPPPAWLADHAGFTPYYLEVDAAAQTAWIVVLRCSHWQISSVNPAPPAVADIDAASAAVWSRLAAAPPPQPRAALWLDYLLAAWAGYGR